MHDRIQLGHQGRYWNDDFKNLSYTKQGVTQEEINDWEQLGYSDQHLKSYTGWMYDNRNVMPEWIDRLENSFGLYNQSYTFYRMDTLEIMPVHSDHFRTYARLNNCEPDQVYRVVMMLEDWKPGHYFELNGVGYVNWKAGDWFKWRGDVPHAASNIGSDPRYTLQITGLDLRVGQLNNLFSFNIPGIKEERNHPTVNYDIVPAINPNNDSNYRYMVYMNNGFINELKEINHDESERLVLNNDGLHVYLYEPLCSYDSLSSGIHTQGFYSEFDEISPIAIRAEELDSISEYAYRNQLTNVTVHSCDYDIDKWYTSYNNLKLTCDDLFLKTQKKIVGIRENPEKQFIRNYICLNWRFTKHRQLVSTFLAGRNGHLSWHFKASFDVLHKDLFFDLSSWETKYPSLYEQLAKGCEYINNYAPLCIDKHSSVTEVEHPLHAMWPDTKEFSPGVTPALFNQVSNNLADYYFEAFIDVVNETRFAQPTANISEKTFQPMQYLRPFVLVAPPKSLEYVKTMGFKTFSEFWDESYDDEFDHGERLAKIFLLLDNLFNMPNAEQRELYTKMIPTLQHNLNRYKELVNKS